MSENVALLCGRGGSESLRDKNLYPVLGRPMMVYPLLAAKAARQVHHVYLSTDSAMMKDVGRQHGTRIIDRPAALATASAQHVDALRHALNWIRSDGLDDVKYLVVLMCNCATYPAGIIDECIDRLDRDPNADSCVTGFVDNDRHPYRVKRMRTDGYLDTWLDLLKTDVSTNRQDLPPCYVLDHALWVLRVSTCFLLNGQKPWAFMGNNILFTENPGSRDIHSVEDVAYTERYLRELGWRESPSLLLPVAG